jgi:hypothetical protein
MKENALLLAEGKTDMDRVLCSLNAWLGYADKNRNKDFTNELLDCIRFTRENMRGGFTIFVS